MTAEHQIGWSRLRKAERLVQIPEHRQQAIALLFKIADLQGYGGDEYNYLPAISVLEKIDSTKKLAIQALERLIETTAQITIREYALKRLAELEPENKLVAEKINHVIGSVIQLAQNYDMNEHTKFKELLFIEHNDYFFWRRRMNSNPSIWKKILRTHDFKQLVIALKQYLKREFWEKEFELYDIAYNLIWDGTQNMTYPEFYQAWYDL
ncbi:hypothetical protein NIES4071_07280 [Calothrix sp. NIES-4071]|nr:hypothetical protein NIES4071_07280 [Calothrix sp. NIES-4071]BAZ55070.1 hypothetical protein NIES4105_07240 [Calothrix sp. NIES-4105]